MVGPVLGGELDNSRGYDSVATVTTIVCLLYASLLALIVSSSSVEPSHHKIS